MTDSISGWHWLAVGPEGQHILRDGREAPADGVWLKHDGPIEPCESGLHLSEHPMDALEWAPGPILCRVEGRGDKEPHGQPVNKWACRERQIFWRVDATEMLRAFARSQALGVLHLWSEPPQVVRDYLETGDEGLRAAARDAVRAAAGATVRAIAEATAGATAWNTAWDTASAAAWASARAAARDEDLPPVWASAWDAVRAVRDAAWTAARADFLARCEALHKEQING